MRVSRCVCEARGVWRGFSNCEISRRAEASFKEMSSCFCAQRSACVLEWGCKFWFDPMIIFFLFISQECPNIAHLNFSPTVQKLNQIYVLWRRKVAISHIFGIQTVASYFIMSKDFEVTSVWLLSVLWEISGCLLFCFFLVSESFTPALFKWHKVVKMSTFFVLYVRWQSTLSVHECKVKERSAIPVQFSSVQQTKT